MERQGPFERVLRSEPPQPRDRTALFIVAAGIALGLLLLILVLPPISVLDDDGGATIEGPVTATIRDEVPPLPPGYEAVSALFDLAAQEPVPSSARPRLTVDLAAAAVDGERLDLFSYQDGEWKRLGDATAVAGGAAAQAELPVLPSNVIVLRHVEGARTILGSLPPGAELDPAAAAALRAVNSGGLAPAADGSIAGGPPQAPAGVRLDVAPTIAAIDPGAVEALNTILASPDLQAVHVQAMLELVSSSGASGIDLDYRAVDAALAGEFVTLIRDLSTGLRADGRTLTLTLPAPVSRGEAIDTFGYDWEALTPLADFVKLAPVEPDQYFARMEAALDYLVPRVGGGKLLLPVGPLSRERGADGLRALTLTEALGLVTAPALQQTGTVAPGSTVQVVAENLTGDAAAAGGLHWDEAARAVSFTYTGLGGQRTVWLANRFSEAFKLELAARYQLGGVFVEDVSTATRDAGLWAVLEQYAQSGSATLVKPNGELLQPHWAATAGALDSDVGPLVTWRAPDDEGTYTLTLIVSDGAVRVARELQVPVGAGEGAAAP